MSRRAEVAGIIRPEVDDRALDREAQDMEGRLDEAATLSPDIDVRGLQRQLERAIPGGGAIGTAIDAVTGGGGGGQVGGADAVPSGDGTVQMAQLEVLNDIQDELEKLAGGGIASGDGGGAAGGGGLLASLSGGALGTSGGGLLGGAAATAGGALAGAGAVIGGSRFALGQGTFGQAGQQALQGRTRFEGLSGAREAVSSPADFLGTGVANMLDPTGLGETAIRRAGQTRVGRLAGRVAGAPANGAAERFGRDIRQRAVNLERPDWLNDLTNPQFSEPRWLRNLTDPQITEPDWLRNLRSGTSTFLSEPDWLGNLNFDLNLPEPDWIDSISEVGANLTVDVPSPTLDLGAQALQREIEDAFDNFRDAIVDDVVDEVEAEFNNAIGGSLG